jgi:hypothetical protein
MEALMVEQPAVAKDFRGEEDFFRWRRCGLMGFGFDLGDGERLIVHLVGVLETIWKKNEKEEIEMGRTGGGKTKRVLNRWVRC